MKIGVDTDVLVYAHMPAMPEHSKVRARLHAFLRSGDVELCISPLVLHELVHVIIDARRFDPPVSMPEALATARLYVGRRNVECLPVHVEAIRRALDLSKNTASVASASPTRSLLPRSSRTA